MQCNKFFFLVLSFFVLSVSACSSKSPPNILLFPKTLAADAANGRLFVADAQDNNFSLINLSDNSIVTGKPLLNKDSSVKIPTLPQDMAALPVGRTSRIFILGSGVPPRNQITILDYDDAQGIRLASIPTISVGGASPDRQADVLSSLLIDPTTNTLFVSNSTQSMIYFYDALSGAEKPGSPIPVGPSPIRLGFDRRNSLLVSSSFAGTAVTLLNLQNLSEPPISLELGIPTSDVAIASNAKGTVLFALNPAANEIRIYQLQFNPPLATLIGNPITPPPPNQTVPANNVLSGSASQIAAVPLADGRIVGVISQSTGDFGFIELSQDLALSNQGKITPLNGQGAFAIEILTDAQGNGKKAYIAAPGGSAVSFFDLEAKTYLGQIL